MKTLIKHITFYYLLASIMASYLVSAGEEDIITKRKPFLVVETCIGTVTDRHEDGRAYGYDHNGNFIGYGNVNNVQLADKVLSFMVWNPFNNYEDDIIARFDFIVGSEAKG